MQTINNTIKNRWAKDKIGVEYIVRVPFHKSDRKAKHVRWFIRDNYLLKVGIEQASIKSYLSPYKTQF